QKKCLLRRLLIMRLLENKVALITGAGGGIGEGVARYFVKQGAAVVVAELNPALGEAVVSDLRTQGGRALFFKTDVSDKQNIIDAVQAGEEDFGGVDILVNDAVAPTPNVLMEDKADGMIEQALGSLVWAVGWAIGAAMA